MPKVELMLSLSKSSAIFSLITLSGLPASIVGGFNNSRVVLRSGAGPSARDAAVGDVVLTNNVGVVVRLRVDVVSGHYVR
jgi:hypothetical protein